MTRMLRAALPLILLLSSGCVDRLAQRRAALSGLVGATEADLVRSLGVPTRSYEAGGRRFLAYTESRIDVIPGFYPYSPWDPFPYAGGIPPQVQQSVCETTFEILDGRVASWSLRGNACG